MLPVVKGDDETRRQIFLYSLVLFATTLVLAPAANLGAIYCGRRWCSAGCSSTARWCCGAGPTPIGAGGCSPIRSCTWRPCSARSRWTRWSRCGHWPAGRGSVVQEFVDQALQLGFGGLSVDHIADRAGAVGDIGLGQEGEAHQRC